MEKTNPYFVLTYNVRQEGKTWLASCVELGTSVYGKSAKEAKKKLQEAVSCHIETLKDVGELGRFFKENEIGHSPGIFLILAFTLVYFHDLAFRRSGMVV